MLRNWLSFETHKLHQHHSHGHNQDGDQNHCWGTRRELLPRQYNSNCLAKLFRVRSLQLSAPLHVRACIYSDKANRDSFRARARRRVQRRAKRRAWRRVLVLVDRKCAQDEDCERDFWRLRRDLLNFALPSYPFFILTFSG